MSLIFAAGAHGQTPEKIVPCNPLSHPELKKLERVHSLGDFRVFYTERPPSSGVDHRLPPQSAIDRNGNGVPDFVENVAKQAEAARQTFNLLGFRDPLESPRYRAVRFIDINILNMAGNGLAADSPIHYSSVGRTSDCTLRIDISSQLETQMVGTPGNQYQAELTKHWFVVAHEVFHLFQYGYTQFKRGWINEPVAKWAEYTMRMQASYPTSPDYTLPATLEEFQTHIAAAPTGTTANRFWARLIELLDTSSDELRVPIELLMTEPYVDGQLIFKDDALRGAAFIGAVYQTLDAEDDIVSHGNGWNYHNWAESDQTSATHDARLLRAIQRVLQRSGVSNAEIRALVEIK